MDKNLVVVNVVGTGQLSTQVNYSDVMDRADTSVLRYDPSIHQGLELRFEEDGPLITVYSTGKYIIRAESVDVLYEVRESFLELMTRINLLDSPSDEEFSINNIVCNGDLGRELELVALAEDLFKGDANYDPHKFPGINYKPQNNPCTILIFRSGKVVVTAAPDIETAENAYQSLNEEIIQLIESGV